MILIDRREGSKHLADHIEPRSLVQLGEYDADVAFMGYGPGGEPVPIGIEYKQIPDVLKCINDGRFSGVQLPRMIETYGEGRIYLLIEGAYRVDGASGILEFRQWDQKTKRMGWRAAQLGRDAWLYRQLDNWLNTMTEMVSLRVWRTYDITESAHWIKDLYVWWTAKAYEEHRAHLKWASPDARLQAASRKHRNVLVPQETSKLPLVRKWANDLPTIGPDKSLVVARHFKTPLALALGTVKDYMQVNGVGKVGANRIVKAIEGED